MTQTDCGLLSNEERQESKHVEYSATEGAIMRNQDTEEALSTMVVIKWLDAIKLPRDKVDSTLCGGLYREYHGSIVPWSVTYPYAKLDCFTLTKEENDWIFLVDQYN